MSKKSDQQLPLQTQGRANASGIGGAGVRGGGGVGNGNGNGNGNESASQLKSPPIFSLVCHKILSLCDLFLFGGINPTLPFPFLGHLHISLFWRGSSMLVA